MRHMITFLAEALHRAARVRMLEHRASRLEAGAGVLLSYLSHRHDQEVRFGLLQRVGEEYRRRGDHLGLLRV